MRCNSVDAVLLTSLFPPHVYMNHSSPLSLLNWTWTTWVSNKISVDTINQCRCFVIAIRHKAQHWARNSNSNMKRNTGANPFCYLAIIFFMPNNKLSEWRWESHQGKLLVCCQSPASSCFATQHYALAINAVKLWHVSCINVTGEGRGGKRREEEAGHR